jgi:hypothetical protein
MNFTTVLQPIQESDVVVVGGGASGVAAAIAAARQGARVLLLEQYGCLGGMMTLGLVMPLSAHSTKSGQSFGGIMHEILERVIAETKRYCGGSGKPHHLFSSPHVMKHVLLELAVDAGVEVLLHATLVDVVREDDTIKHLVILTKSGLRSLQARIFIDATGDGDLLARAGAEFVLGSEPGVLGGLRATGLNKVHKEAGEYGDYSRDGVLQPVTMMFTMGGVDTERAKPFVNRKLSFAELGLTREDFAALPYANSPGFTLDGDDLPLPQGRVLFFKIRRPGEVVINMTRITSVNGADATELARGTIAGQRQVFHVLDFLLRFVPGFANAYLIETADILGVRETRRLVGRHVLTGQEAIECVPFEDVVAHGSYIIDIHDPQGRRKAIGGPIRGECYDIPYRSLLPKSVDNLLVAGRCISSDHVAHSSTRIQGTCMLTGQAAGTAAALALRMQVTVAELPVRQLQNALIAAGVRLRLTGSIAPGVGGGPFGAENSLGSPEEPVAPSVMPQ